MTIFLAVVAVVCGLIGLAYLGTGPAFVGVVWLILALLGLVAIPVLNLLTRIARATEQMSDDAGRRG